MTLFHHQAKVTPKDFFLYLGMVITLFVSVGSLVKLLFDIINVSFPDQLSHYAIDPYSAGMRLAIASLLIVFPVYLLISRYLAKQVRGDKDKRELWIRKWLIYLILFIAGVFLIGDLIALVNVFLSGEITIRFILKVLAILIVFGGVFGGYAYVIRAGEPKKSVLNSLLGGALIVVIASLIGGFLVIGSPTTARQLSFDDQRINDLQSIQWRIIEHWRAKGELPSKLDDLKDSISGFSAPVDPVTGQSYGYVASGELQFELCADFALPSRELNRSDSVMPRATEPGMGRALEANWSHQAGRDCFVRTIDPELYKPLR